MHTIKRLDIFLLKTFLPLFLMTFGICLFIYLMQFLWRSINEIVGKGVDIGILLEMFFYAIFAFVPQALPLAILFASLMTFGNLGEQYELTAMKASGISLVRIMSPLIVFLFFVAIAAFIFQNNISPKSFVKMYTILRSVQQKSPELEIPESTFYGQIEGINLYVRSKDKGNKLLKDVMIYDYSKGFNDASIIMADSGRLKMSTDKQYLILTLYNGESFANLEGSKNRAREAKDVVPYRRQSFDLMERFIEFDANFKMQSEDILSNRYIGKDFASLRHTIDSMEVELDSVRTEQSRAMYAQSYRRTLAKKMPDASISHDTLTVKSAKDVLKFDSLYSNQDARMKASVLNYARRNIERLQLDYGFKSDLFRYNLREKNRNYAEMHRKFVLSFACLIFFFIGAPLGAIIRKGGLGTPAVISVLLFVFYYIIDNMGYKMARDGVWTPWIGMWLSSAVLLPMGIFFTYKAVNDSTILSADTYVNALKKFIGKREVRKVEKKEVIMEKPDYALVLTQLENIKNECGRYLSDNKRWLGYLKFWQQGGLDIEAESIAHKIEDVVEILGNSDRLLVLNKLMDMPIVNGYRLVNFKIDRKLCMTFAVVFPIGLLIYFLAVYRRKLLRQDFNTTIKVCNELIQLVRD